MSLSAFQDAFGRLHRGGEALGRLIASDFAYDPGSFVRTLARTRIARRSRRAKATEKAADQAPAQAAADRASRLAERT